ncbi:MULTISPECIES: GNAT family N-acetyltransferase [unclassified Pseudodesulfovibrio]|uniref:GNAT family N-acetyltransferase n=1 Tax=unclassified Pseudodesulfovibrio TaxID=2661612 RepID=UPI000FEB8C17|nr:MULTISPECIES: GNAT family N-acetyltransferase [unclassified Pseudodesulfovibrio]MCJ2164561.1 GNAT family N-acetyltransferase [Pseudodesulfovibrio sp. S3-i]RWU04759.1 GNAT family N-acetyltransferase [Pseudodesulfovibrio sp. S3]
MDTTIREDELPEEMREVRISSGITPKDVEPILNMAAASGLFSSDAMMSAEDMAWDSAYGNGEEMQTFLLAKVNEGELDRIIGFLCFGPIGHWPDMFELYGITVDPEFRRLGIGSALVAEMVRRVEEQNGKQIFLETGEDRAFENARSFYEANDFSQQQRFCKQFIPLEGGVVYHLNIDNEDSDKNFQ